METCLALIFREGIPVVYGSNVRVHIPATLHLRKSRPAMNGKIDRSQRGEARECEIVRFRGRKREMKTETRREALQQKLAIRPSAHKHAKRIYQTIQTYTNTAVMSVNKVPPFLARHPVTARRHVTFLNPAG